MEAHITHDPNLREPVRQTASVPEMQEGPPHNGTTLLSKCRRRPTLPGPFGPSTIGAGGLNFRVRNGNGWNPAAMATETI